MNRNRNVSVLTGLVVTVMGLVTLALGTDGFAAYTSEGARRLAILNESRPIPNVTLQNQDETYFDLRDLRGKMLVVEFVYTTCPTICNALGLSFQRLRDALPRSVLGRDVVLLSISFNPELDEPKRLKNYGDRFGADGDAWRIARVTDERQLKGLLQAFGVIVIPNEYGGFEHNAAIHLADRDGKLISIDDHDRVAEFTEKLSARL